MYVAVLPDKRGVLIYPSRFKWEKIAAVENLDSIAHSMLDWKVCSIISTPDEIQLCDSRGQVTQFARHQAAHGETGSKTIPTVYRGTPIPNIEVPGLHRTALGDAK